MLDVTNRITSEQFSNLKQFLNLPQDYDELQAILQFYHDENILKLYNSMDQTEKNYISTFLKNNDSLILINKKKLKKLPILYKYGAITFINEDTFDVNNIILDAINRVALNEKYPELWQKTYREQLYIEKLHIQYKAINKFKDISLKEELDQYNIDSLKSICRHHNIKGFSNKRKALIIDLIVKKVFQDFTIIKEELSSMTPKIFDIFIDTYKSGKNVNTDYDLEELNSHLGIEFHIFAEGLFILRFDTYDGVIIIPKDVMEHFSKYVDSIGGIENVIADLHALNNNEDFFENEILDLLNDDKDLPSFLGIEEENINEDALKDLFSEKSINSIFTNTLNNLMREELVEDKITKIKKENKSSKEITLFRFYVAATNLYGVVSLQFISKLLKQLLNTSKTKNEIKLHIQSLDIKDFTVIKQGYLVHPLIAPYIDPTESESLPFDYYIPSSLKELLYYDIHEYYKETKVIKNFKKFLKQFLTTKDNEEINSHINLLLHELRSSPDPDQALMSIETMIDGEILRPIPEGQLITQFQKIWNELRLWAAKGHTVLEIDKYLP